MVSRSFRTPNLSLRMMLCESGRTRILDFESHACFKSAIHEPLCNIGGQGDWESIGPTLMFDA